jgi:flagellar hook-basal body complex protein FliE
MKIPSIPSLEMSSLQEFQSISKANSTTANSTSSSSSTEKISSAFSDVLNSLNESQNTADTLIQQLAAGEDVDLHDVIIATEENDVNFKVAMAIRDRLVDAYREVMRMSV